MEKLKTRRQMQHIKEKNLWTLPKEAATLFKQDYEEQQRQRQGEKPEGVGDAVNRVETAGKQGTALAIGAAWRMAAKRRQERYQKRTGRPIGQPAVMRSGQIARGALFSVRLKKSLLLGLCGGTLLMLVLAMALVGAVAASPFGILMVGETPSPGAVTLQEAMTQVEERFEARLEELSQGNYDSVTIQGDYPNWREVLAVFAVRTATSETDAMDVVTMDEARITRLETVFSDMCQVTTRVDVTRHPDSDPNDGIDDSYRERDLTITLTPQTAEEMKRFYYFTQFQINILNELLDQDSMS